MTTLFTIGHSSHPLDRFFSLLRRHRIEVLVDVRSRPWSKWAPHFQKEPLADSLTAAGIDYVFLGRELGGKLAGDADLETLYRRRARSQEFLDGIERLVGIAEERTTAIMCAEEDPDRCHRRLLITPALVQKDVRVLHIRGDGRVQAEEELPARASQLRFFE